ncbi:hypothetical protein HNP73_000706 [Amaricoccus macauensis]|uniref:Uncharacterized protein n=1 Tax=Amaricoccus macauensis TaxID=57001 RepID=A0A840SJG4_9RHOB|nr:hypothetical protein [Amaricoccus macauensis]
MPEARGADLHAVTDAVVAAIAGEFGDELASENISEN